MEQCYEAITYYRRRNFEKCIEICNEFLRNESGRASGFKQNFSNKFTAVGKENEQWVIENIWQLKMQAQTQRVYVDDLETNDDNFENEEVEFERIATTARPGTSIKTAFRPTTRSLFSASGANRPRTLSSRPLTGISRPGTTSNRPGSAISSRPPTRSGTARRVRVTTAAAYASGDSTSNFFQAARMNPTIYAEKQNIVKPLFIFLFYHEGDPQKALSLCEAVFELKKKVDWWWEQQRGRCLLVLNHPRRAEEYFKKSLAIFPHIDTYLLMCKMYLKLEQPLTALQLLDNALDRSPYDTSLQTHKARINEFMEKVEESVQCYRKIVQLNPINPEASACIAVNYFYDNQPEMALMYYRRILSMGAHSAELYCNIGLCCLYGGQIDLILPCFQRAIHLATTPEQKADIWYNLSFAALTSGDFNLAKRCLRLCLSLDSANGAAMNNLAVLSAQIGDISKAKSYLMSAQNTFIECPEIEKNLKILERY